MQIPELQANVEVELGTGSKQISNVKNKNRSMAVYSAHANTRAIPPTNATAATTAPTRPPLTAGMPRAPPFRAESEPLEPPETTWTGAASCGKLSGDV